MCLKVQHAFLLLYPVNKDFHTICQCLKDVDKDDIIEVGLSLGLYYPRLNGMLRSPHDMISAWLQQKDNVIGKTGEPTAQKLIQALKEVQLTGIADDVESKFCVT